MTVSAESNTSSHALLKVFAANGIDRVFVVPGESYLGVLDALHDFPQIDVVTCHVDSPKAVLETAKKRGMMTCGYHANGSAIDPDKYLTGAEWNWAPIYINYVKMIQAGKKPEHVVRGGLKDGFVKTSPLGKLVTPEIAAKIAGVKATAMDGKLVIFKGPLKDNTGKEVIAAGKEMIQTDDALEGMSYLVEGVIGSTK